MIKALKSTLRFIRQHPLNRNRKLAATLFFFYWQLKSRLNKGTHFMKWTGTLKLAVRNGMAGATGALYVGLPEFEDMGFVIHFLRKDDLFIDVGSNVGVYSLLASGMKKARSVAFEPIPSTYAVLKENIALNHLDALIRTHNMGVGSVESALKFTKNFDTINHVVYEERDDTIEVPVKTLDQLIGQSEIDPCAIMKIDVEGFEMEVLKGAASLLGDTRLKAVIMEMNGCGEKFGVSDADLDRKIISFGFEKYNYDPLTRTLTVAADFNHHGNTIYLRDLEVVRERLRSSAAVTIFKTQI